MRVLLTICYKIRCCCLRSWGLAFLLLFSHNSIACQLKRVTTARATNEEHPAQINQTAKCKQNQFGKQTIGVADVFAKFAIFFFACIWEVENHTTMNVLSLLSLFITNMAFVSFVFSLVVKIVCGEFSRTNRFCIFSSCRCTFVLGLNLQT